MLHLFRHFYREDLQKLGATLGDYVKRTLFLETMANNSNYFSTTPDGRTAVKLYGTDLEWADELEASTGIKCSPVSWDVNAAGLKEIAGREDLGLKEIAGREDLGLKEIAGREDLGLKEIVGREDLGLKEIVGREDLGLKEIAGREDLGNA